MLGRATNKRCFQSTVAHWGLSMWRLSWRFQSQPGSLRRSPRHHIAPHCVAFQRTFFFSFRCFIVRPSPFHMDWHLVPFNRRVSVYFLVPDCWLGRVLSFLFSCSWENALWEFRCLRVYLCNAQKDVTVVSWSVKCARYRLQFVIPTFDGFCCADINLTNCAHKPVDINFWCRFEMFN